MHAQCGSEVWQQVYGIMTVDMRSVAAKCGSKYGIMTVDIDIFHVGVHFGCVGHDDVSNEASPAILTAMMTAVLRKPIPPQPRLAVLACMICRRARRRRARPCARLRPWALN